MATQQTLAILESAFAHDAAMGELRGVDALMEQLRLYSEWFGNPKLHLQRVEAVAPGVMAATATLNVTVTELTLRHVFPHLVESAGENNCERLCQRLLGQRLDCSSAVTFLFDEDSDRIVRLEASIDMMTPLLRMLGSIEDASDLEASIDMMTPLLRMLGSIEDASEVLKHSRITAECTISCAPDQ
ncbi:Bzip transcription factor [Phytophthora palmivora]|uniref:Bzip transcription factor n=1 Tax=Phytophthora palmivora TaxID=4796 RepID=A0A2P4XZQ8_9STRA|nr:Bzip transcription factor [Phytophthora palmivora]